jgi:glutamine amidotransferase
LYLLLLPPLKLLAFLPCTLSSLAHQSEAAGFTPGLAEDSARNHTVNVHGCGIGWYSNKPGGGLVDATGLSSYERPAVYTTTSAPTHDRNLRSLTKMLETTLLFGHVRAAGPGASVHQFNCHPFQAGRFLFMHNGEIAGASWVLPVGGQSCPLGFNC